MEGLGHPAPGRSDDDCFGNSVMYRLAVWMSEELKEAKSSLKRRSGVAEGSLDRVPQRHVAVDKRHHSNAEQVLSNGAPFAEIGTQAKVRDRDSYAAKPPELKGQSQEVRARPLQLGPSARQSKKKHNERDVNQKSQSARAKRSQLNALQLCLPFNILSLECFSR